MNNAGIVLCGGQSKRMGRPKADLVFGHETLLQRVVGRLQSVVPHVIVVGADGQTIPEFAGSVSVVRDPVPGGGPIVGLGVGLAAANKAGDVAAFVTTCDSPFLSPKFVAGMFERLSDFDVAVPKDNQYHYPLAAVYRTELHQKIEELFKSGVRRPRALYDVCKTLEIPTADLVSIDPELESLENLNSPDDYRRALEKAELAVPDWLGLSNEQE